jgi:Prefoldin, molecular chaperone implicated in de novo protein folding, alpha subunit
LRSSDGFIVPSIEAAKNLIKYMNNFQYVVQVDNSSISLIKDLRKVLVKHVKKVEPKLEAGSEVIIVDENNNVIGVGRTVLSGEEMMVMKRGTAVKIRKLAI